MSDKKTNLYQLQLKELELKTLAEPNRQLNLQFEYHNDLFEIFNKVSSKNLFDTEEEMKQFMLGLKLMTAIVLKDKENPLFEELKPTIMNFKKTIKPLNN